MTQLRSPIYTTHKNLLTARCKCFHLIKKYSKCLTARTELILIRCKHPQQAVSQFLLVVEMGLYSEKIFSCKVGVYMNQASPPKNVSATVKYSLA